MKFLSECQQIIRSQKVKAVIGIAVCIAAAVMILLYNSQNLIKKGINIEENRSFIVTGHVYANLEEFLYILSDARARNISTLLLGGDIEDTILNKINEYEKEYGLRIVVTPGNHEIQEENSARSFYSRFESYHKEQSAGLNILVLDTMLAEAPPYPHGGVGIMGKQLEFLKNQLQDLKDEPVIIIMHHALWAPNLTSKELQKMAPKAGLSEGINIGEIQFPANDTGPNSWMKDVHPLLVEHGNVHVFAGDASLSTILEKDGVNYYTSGLRQPQKEVWVKDGRQSYLQCNQAQRKIYCDIVFFDKDLSDHGAATANYKEFTGTLSKLVTRPSVSMTMDLQGLDISDGLTDVTYLTVEKNEHACEFPGFGLMVIGNGIYAVGKSFEGIDLSPSKRFYFIQSRPKRKDSIQKLQYYLFQNPGNLCNSFIVNFFTEDFNKLLEPLRPKINEYRISIGQKDYDELLAGIPDESKDRYNSNFQFPSVKAELTHQSTIYDMKIKNRGGTSHHWANDKKSYTVNFKDYFKHSDKLLFYIPDKRAYTGEYLVNELAHEMSLPALNSGFAKLSINGKDQGVYYVSEDFDSLFLAKKDLPKANIYNTDPYQNPDKFTTEAVPKEMILSTLKDFEDAYDKDADYFLSVIKKNSLELQRNWKYHFDPDNLSKILALYSISGTAHYDFHNIVFYINPASGRIYFFPWDFMNYTHVGDLQREDLIDFPNDYLNVNRLFSQLLEIPEIRNMRNKAIYEYADILTARLVQFEEDEHIGLITNFMADPTTAYYVGDGNKPSFVTYLQTPSILKSNIQYLTDKIETMSVFGYIDQTGTVLLKSDSFNDVRLTKLMISGLHPDPVGSIQVNTSSLAVEDYTVKQAENGSKEILLQRDVILSPTLTYTTEYATPIYLESGYLQIDLQNKSGTPLSVVAVEVENPATSHTQIIPLSTGTFFKAGALPQVPAVSGDHKVNDPLLKEVDSSTVTFIRSDVEITKDIVIPKGITLQIAPGTVVTFAEGVSLISYGPIIAKGTKKQPITFTAIDPKKPWGAVVLLQEDASGIFNHTIFEYGSDAKTNNRVYASGMLSGYYSDITVTNSIFRYSNRNGGDDAVNIKYGKAVIQGNRFYENKYDGLDLDFVKKGSIVSGNRFEDNGDDGMDISGTTDLIIKNNRIRASGDKGISVGEDSHITIINNSIEDTQMGIAVKDNSTVILNHNNIINNSVGAAAYNKKELFGGGHIKVYNTLFKENKQDFGLESISKRDRRFLDQDYQSTIEVINSEYRLTGKETKELIKEAEKSVSKRDSLETFLKGKLTTAKGTYATLKDTASRMKDYRLSDISNPIGTTK